MKALVEVWDWERVGPPNFLGKATVELVPQVVVIGENGV